MEYVSSAEHKRYPFTATQWHPEKPPYEFGMKVGGRWPEVLKVVLKTRDPPPSPPLVHASHLHTQLALFDLLCLFSIAPALEGSGPSSGPCPWCTNHLCVRMDFADFLHPALSLPPCPQEIPHSLDAVRVSQHLVREGAQCPVLSFHFFCDALTGAHAKRRAHQ